MFSFVYVKYWFTAQSVTSVTIYDYNLIKELIQYKNVNKKVSKAIKNLTGHFWHYLSEIFISLAFFKELKGEKKMKGYNFA